MNGKTSTLSPNPSSSEEERTQVETSELLERVKMTVHNLVPEAEVILYGSQARGTAGAYSDWDFLILLPARDKGLEAEMKDRLYDLELETDTVLSTLIRTQKEWRSSRYAVLPIRQEIERDGIVL